MKTIEYLETDFAMWIFWIFDGLNWSLCLQFLLYRQQMA